MALRHRTVAGVALPSGLYLFEADDGLTAMVVADGAVPSMPTRSDWSADDDHPLIRAFDWFEAWWDEATDVPAPRFAPGQSVLVLPDNQEAHIRSRDYEQGHWWYRVRTGGRTQDFRETSLAEPSLDDDPHEWIQRTASNARRLAATLTRAKLAEELTDTVYSFRASRTVFRPYQFRPVLRLLESGSLRLLVADEVGLGKTIEAGLVWTELDARRQANRVLVVCPSGLVGKWQDEMEQRFGYELMELRQPELNDLLERFEDDRFPSRFAGVVSVERLRVWNGLERLSELAPRFDLVVVDEAHVFRNSGTRSHALGALLSDWSDALVFLSATPLNLGNDDLYNLLELLAPGEFDDRTVLEQRLAPNAILNRVAASLTDRSVTPGERIGWLDRLDDLVFGPTVTRRPEYADLRSLVEQPVTAATTPQARRAISRLHALSAVVTRTRKIEVEEHKAVREPIPIDVAWTATEAKLYRAYDDWQRERARRRGVPVGFATQIPLRLASTCLPAARDQVLALASGAAASARSDYEIDEELDETGTDDFDLLDFDDELPPDELVAAARQLGDVDTKYDRFEEQLRRIVESGKQVLVFSFSRPTLAYLERRLTGAVRTVTMHGGVPREERPELIGRFRRGDFDVMLASRVASEGLDFEFCSAVVNYDLPWNPMEVEQRIGRIDRFGQTEEKILVLNFHTPGTVETDIVERVHSRIGVFTDSIGELEPIIRHGMGQLRKAMFDFTLTLEQRERRIDESLAAIEEQRLALDEVENASTFLASADQADIDGLERDLLGSGRYIGQPELVLLLESWIERTEGARCKVSADGHWFHVIGSPALEADVRNVQTVGERSASEIDLLARDLRNEVEVHLCLDQEHARRNGAPLLTANHPFVRAALAASGTGTARHAAVRLRSADLEPGRFLVLVSLARWNGVRPSAEMWTSAVALDGSERGPEVGNTLLSALAEASWGQGAVDETPLDRALSSAMSMARRRQLEEEARRSEENSALLDLRRLSLRETFRRKRNVISRRIETARSRGSAVAIRLGESQLAAQDRLLRDAEDDLDRAANGSMVVEHIAVADVEIVR